MLSVQGTSFFSPQNVHINILSFLFVYLSGDILTEADKLLATTPRAEENVDKKKAEANTEMENITKENKENNDTTRDFHIYYWKTIQS